MSGCATRLLLQVHRDEIGGWSITGLPNGKRVICTDLCEGLNRARRECASAPAVIELLSDGIYVVISQDAGWPHPLFHPSKPVHRNAQEPHPVVETLASAYRSCRAWWH